MTTGSISSEKIDLLIYGPVRPILDNGFSDHFVVHKAETRGDLERLTPAIREKIRGVAVTYHTVRADKDSLSQLPKIEMVASFGVGYDHIDAKYAAEHNIIVAMGRIGQAIARRLDASLVPVVYHTRNPSKDVSYKHYPDLIEMAKAVDTLMVIVPGGASTNKMINAEVLKALGPRGVLVNVARGSVVDEPALVAALKSGTILAAGLDVFANEPNVPDELKAMQNVVLLPHIGSASVVTRNAMDQLVVDNLKNWFAGKAPLTPVPETPVKGR